MVEITSTYFICSGFDPIFVQIDQIRIYAFRADIVFGSGFNDLYSLVKAQTLQTLATEKDERITKIEQLLRASRLDELPQLINVFPGEMSMVGPRPERLFFIGKFSKEIPSFRYRTLIKAGGTGLGQVLGKYTTTPMDKLTVDIIYIRNYSFLLDLKLCVETVQVLFSKLAGSGFSEE